MSPPIFTTSRLFVALICHIAMSPEFGKLLVVGLDALMKIGMFGGTENVAV
jgi:hypothetical protein